MSKSQTTGPTIFQWLYIQPEGKFPTQVKSLKDGLRCLGDEMAAMVNKALTFMGCINQGSLEKQAQLG